MKRLLLNNLNLVITFMVLVEEKTETETKVDEEKTEE